MDEKRCENNNKERVGKEESRVPRGIKGGGLLSSCTLGPPVLSMRRAA